MIMLLPGLSLLPKRNVRRVSRYHYNYIIFHYIKKLPVSDIAEQSLNSLYQKTTPTPTLHTPINPYLLTQPFDVLA